MYKIGADVLEGSRVDRSQGVSRKIMFEPNWRSHLVGGVHQLMNFHALHGALPVIMRSLGEELWPVAAHGLLERCSVTFVIFTAIIRCSGACLTRDVVCKEHLFVERIPKPSTINTQPQSRNTKPSTLDPKH